MRLESGNFCPVIGGDCKQLECKWFIHLRGADPQSGQEIDEYDCAIKWLPTLLIENAKETRQGAAATESFRNVMLELNRGTSPDVIEQRAQARLIKNGS